MKSYGQNGESHMRPTHFLHSSTSTSFFPNHILMVFSYLSFLTHSFTLPSSLPPSPSSSPSLSFSLFHIPHTHTHTHISCTHSLISLPHIFQPLIHTLSLTLLPISPIHPLPSYTLLPISPFTLSPPFHGPLSCGFPLNQPTYTPFLPSSPHPTLFTTICMLMH